MISSISNKVRKLFDGGIAARLRKSPGIIIVETKQIAGGFRGIMDEVFVYFWPRSLIRLLADLLPSLM